MATKDLAALMNVVQTLRPQATTVNRTGTGVDLFGYEGAVCVVDSGLWTDGTHTVDIQDSDDNTTFAAVAAANLQGTKPVINSGTVDEQFYEVGYIGAKRYLRVDVGVAGATTGAVIGAGVMRGHPKVVPA